MNKFIRYSVFPEEEEFGTDPWEYRLELNGEIIATFGDDYHDKGYAKCKGFIKGYAYAKSWKEKLDYTIEYKEIVDETL